MNNILRIICVLALGVPVFSRGKNSINLALETSLLFEPHDTEKHMELINEARRFLDVLENAIMPKKALREDRPKQPLTDFISRLADTILQLYPEDLEMFFKVLENEMKSQFLKGSIFRDIVYDPKLQTFIRNKLKEWANTDPRQMKAKLRRYMARESNENDTLHELGRFLNDYYGTEQEFKMDEIIERLRNTLDESEIATIVRDALNTLVLQHYDKMNYTTRAKLVEKINTLKHEYFTSQADHDLMLTFRGKRKKPKKSNSLVFMDAWLQELEKKGAADADIDLSDVDVRVPAEDRDAPILTLDDWDSWLSKRNMKGIRKINTLMSDEIEEMIRDTEDSKLKNKHKYNDEAVKVRTGERNMKGIRKINTLMSDEIEGMIKDTEDSKLKNKHKYNDEAVKVRTGERNMKGIRKINTLMSDEIEEMIKDTEDSKLKNKRKYNDEAVKENYESIDEPEKVKTTTDFQIGKTVVDESIDEPEQFEARVDMKRSSKIDESIDESRDEPERVKTTPNSRLGSHENDESTDKPDKVKTTADSTSRSNKNDNLDELKKSKTSRFKFRKKYFDVSEDEPEKKTTANSKSGRNENHESTDESKNIKTTADSKLEKGKTTKDFKAKHNRHKTRKHKPIKFNADFILGKDHNKESIVKLKKDKGTADFKYRHNRDELTEDDIETSTRNTGLTTVDVFSQVYGIKPNKELIIDKDLEIFVGGFDATLVGNDKNN